MMVIRVQHSQLPERGQFALHGTQGCTAKNFAIADAVLAVAFVAWQILSALPAQEQWMASISNAAAFAST